MKVNELRIGNIVSDEWGYKIVVVSINKKGINLDIEDDGNYPELAQHFIEPEYTFDKLRGIPLTEEILLKLGLRWRQLPDRKYKQYIIHNDFCVEYDGNAFVFRRVSSEEVICFVPYLHTLQNAVYLVAGEELDVTELLKSL